MKVVQDPPSSHTSTRRQFVKTLTLALSGLNLKAPPVTVDYKVGPLDHRELVTTIPICTIADCRLEITDCGSPRQRGKITISDARTLTGFQRDLVTSCLAQKDIKVYWTRVPAGTEARYSTSVFLELPTAEKCAVENKY